MLTLLNLLSAIALLIWGTHIVRTGILRVYGSNLRRLLSRSVRRPGSRSCTSQNDSSPAPCGPVPLTSNTSQSSETSHSASNVLPLPAFHSNSPVKSHSRGSASILPRSTRSPCRGARAARRSPAR